MEQIYVIMYNIMVDQFSMFRAIDFSAPQSAIRTEQSSAPVEKHMHLNPINIRLQTIRYKPCTKPKTIHIVFQGKLSVLCPLPIDQPS